MNVSLRICLVGYGGIGKVHAYGYRNLHLYYDLPRPQLVGVVARTESSRRQAIADHDFLWSHEDYQAAIIAEDVDIVDCCAPNHLHYPIAKLALDSRKTIYCEKPLALTLTEAAELAQQAQNSGVPHQIAFNYRFVPAVLTARELVRQGKLGKIVQFRGAYYHSGYWDRNRPLTWRMQKEFSGGGALYDLGSHIIDMIRFVTGDEYSSVSATLHTEIKTRPLPEGGVGEVDVDDVAILQVKTHSGALGTIEASRLATGTEDDLSFEIYGEKGALRFHLMEPNWLDWFDGAQPGAPLSQAKGFTRLAASSRYPKPAKFPAGRSPMGWLQTHVASQADFIQRCLGQEALGATFVDGLQVQRVLTAAQESDATRAWVAVDLLS